MKRLLTLLIFCALYTILPQPTFAENWHPFPFKIAYYGKRASLNATTPALQAIAKGWVVDGLYLDSSDSERRLRSKKYPSSSNIADFDQAVGQFLGRINVNTSEDSQTVFCQNASDFHIWKGVFYPKSQGFENRTPSHYSVENIFGVQDSVAWLISFSDTLCWSKKFGIYSHHKTSMGMPDVDIKLLGVKDLNLGWHDQTFRRKLPQPGDEIHLWKQHIGSIFCNSPWGTSTYGEGEDKHLRIKVLSSNTSGIFVNVIESEPGASTGISYDVNMSYMGSTDGVILNDDSVRAVGTLAPTNNLTNEIIYLGFLNDQGQSMKMTYHWMVDLPSANAFLFCAKMPLTTSTLYGLNSQWCTGSINRIQFPVYVHVEGGCDFGTPFPTVTITSINKEQNQPTIRLLQQLAQDYIRFEGTDQGDFLIFDAVGKPVLSGRFSGQPIFVNHLPVGVYFWNLSQNNQVVAKGKMMKE